MEFLSEARLKRTYKTQIVVVLRLMEFLWIRNTGKEADPLFTITVGINFWVLEEHDTIIGFVSTYCITQVMERSV